jgi:hypothetical protein
LQLCHWIYRTLYFFEIWERHLILNRVEFTEPHIHKQRGRHNEKKNETMNLKPQKKKNQKKYTILSKQQVEMTIFFMYHNATKYIELFVSQSLCFFFWFRKEILRWWKKGLWTTNQNQKDFRNPDTLWLVLYLTKDGFYQFFMR